jgi:hypothetical protein
MSRHFLPAGTVFLLALAAGAVPLFAQHPQQDLIDRLPVAPRIGERLGVANRPIDRTTRILRARTDFKVEIMPLAEFAKFLTRRYNIPVRLDADGLERAGVAPSVPVSAEISHMPLSAALRQILGRYNLSPRVVNGVVLISDRGPQPAAPIAEQGRVILHNGQAVIIQRGVQAGNVGGALKEQALRQLGPLLQVELIFAKRTCKPTTDQMRNMRDDLRKFVKDEVNDFFDLMQGRVARTGGGFRVARKLLDDRLATFVEKNLSKEEAARYRDELQKRDANEREVCALNLVALLDRELCLTPKQRDAIQKSLLENWDDGWSQTVEVGAMRGQNYVPSIPDEVIENHLDAAQIEVWGSMTKIGNVNWGFQVFRLGWFGMPVDERDQD